jgi:hypothetical protein
MPPTMITDGDRRHDARGVCDPATVPAIPVSRTALWTGGAAVAVGLLATAALLPVGPLSVRAGLLALGCVLVGIAAQLGSAVMLPPRNGAGWAMLALFAHGVRLGVSLACGLWVTLLSRPDRVGFWSVFLAASLAAITAEAALIVRASQRLWRGPRGGNAPRGVHQP